jgi:hypothetical protein
MVGDCVGVGSSMDMGNSSEYAALAGSGAVGCCPMRLRKWAALLAATAAAAVAGCGSPGGRASPGCAAEVAPRDAASAERELLAVERAIFAAIQRRDRTALESFTTEDFVLRVPGSADVDRAGFLAAIAAIPGEILAVDGEHVAARLLGPDDGIVTCQTARVRVEGRLPVDRQAFADVFVRRGDRWLMIFAFGTVTVAAGAPSPAPGT